MHIIKHTYARRMAANSLLNVLLALVLLVQFNPALAQSYQSHKSLKQAAKDHLINFHANHNKKTITVGNLDRRLRVAKCKSTPETFFLPGSKKMGNTTIGIKCLHPEKWTVYVPASAKIFKKVLVSSNSLPRNRKIEASDFKFEEKEISKIISGYFDNPENIIGKLTRRSVPPGYLFTPATLKTPRLVLRGEDVAIILNTDNFSIRVAGVALMDGSKEQKIKVRNKASKKVLDAIVTARGIVSVRL